MRGGRELAVRSGIVSSTFPLCFSADALILSVSVSVCVTVRVGNIWTESWVLHVESVDFNFNEAVVEAEEGVVEEDDGVTVMALPLASSVAICVTVAAAAAAARALCCAFNSLGSTMVETTCDVTVGFC